MKRFLPTVFALPLFCLGCSNAASQADREAAPAAGVNATDEPTSTSESNAIEESQAHCVSLKVLGSYPEAQRVL